MRILQLSSARHFGGGERHFVDLTNGLTENGHELFVAANPDSPILAELRKRASPDLFKLSASKALNFAKLIALRRFVHEHSIEIVHAHMARDYPLAALAVGRNRDARLIITRHVLFPMSKLHRITRRRVAKVIAVSQAVASVVRAQGIFRDDQIDVVPNGIDLAKFRPRVAGHSSGRLRVGILGEWTPNKGQIEFGRAAEIVAAKIANVAFIIAGRDNSNEGEYGRQLKKLIEASSIRDRIQLIESRIDVAQLLSSIDVVVSASKSEAFGLAIVEAMAAGVPVIATATAGSREIISVNETGCLVPISDINKMASAMAHMLKNPAKRQQISESAREMVTGRFSVKRMISGTEAVYREAINA